MRIFIYTNLYIYLCIYSGDLKEDTEPVKKKAKKTPEKDTGAVKEKTENKKEEKIVEKKEEKMVNAEKINKVDTKKNDIKYLVVYFRYICIYIYTSFYVYTFTHVCMYI
jgi:hypothetical protein